MGFCTSLGSQWDVVKVLCSMIMELPKRHKLFLGLVLLQAILVVADRISVLVLRDFSIDTAWFFGLLVISVGFVAYFAIHAVLFANAFELLAFFGATAMLVARLAFEFNDKQCSAKGLHVLCITTLTILIFLNVCQWAMLYHMWTDLKWKKYKSIGANLATIRMYQWYELFVAIRKLDLQFSLVVLFSGLVYFQLVWVTLPNVLVFCIELAWERFGFIGIRTENRTYMRAFFGLSWLLPGFVVLCIAAVVVTRDSLSDDIEWKLIVTAALALTNRVLTVMVGWVMYRNFGKNYEGLRAIFRRENDRWAAAYGTTLAPAAQPAEEEVAPKKKAPPPEPEPIAVDLTAGGDVAIPVSSSTAAAQQQQQQQKKKKKDKTKKKTQRGDVETANPLAGGNAV